MARITATMILVGALTSSSLSATASAYDCNSDCGKLAEVIPCPIFGNPNRKCRDPITYGVCLASQRLSCDLWEGAVHFFEPILKPQLIGRFNASTYDPDHDADYVTDCTSAAVVVLAAVGTSFGAPWGTLAGGVAGAFIGKRICQQSETWGEIGPSGGGGSTLPVPTLAGTCEPASEATAWEPLGGELTSVSAAVSLGGGQIHVFGRGRDNALWHTYYLNRWYPWESLGGALTSAPAVVSLGEGQIHVFGRGTDNTLQHTYFLNRWFPWESLGGVLTSRPSVAFSTPGRLDVFARGTDDGLWQKRFENGWGDWKSRGGVLTSEPDLVSWGNGCTDVFARGTNNGLWYLRL